MRISAAFAAAAVITLATERTIETHFGAAVMHVERDAALGCHLSERSFRLKLIDVHITSPRQGSGGKEEVDATLVFDA